MSDDDDERPPPNIDDWIDLDLSACVDRLAPAFELAGLVRRVEDILAQEGRSPVLTGPRGVGKTAVIHELVRRAGAGEGTLAGARVVQISLAAVAGRFKDAHAGADTFRGLLDQVAAAEPPVVPFFRDLHLAFRYDWEPALLRYCGRARRPLLGEGMARELAQLLEYTPDLGESLVLLPVHEPDGAALRRIVDAWCDHLASRGGPVVTPDARRLAIELCSRYLGGQHFPRKVLDLLRQVRDLTPGAEAIGQPDVAARFSETTRVPAPLVDPDAVLDLAETRRFIADRLLGQAEAVDAVVRMVALIKAGLADVRRPFGVFMFVGPTGVGKTHCAQLLAEYLFGDRSRLVRFNMADYGAENHTVLLFGNPYGQSLDERRGQVATRLGGTSFGVLLLDEFEKANEKVHDALLQLVDEGRFVNGLGETISARSLIILATSNAGAEVYREAGLGFAQARDQRAVDAELDRRLHARFRFEFLNRFDRIVHFHPLDRQHIRAIAERELEELVKRDGLAGRGVVVEPEVEVVDWLVSHGWHPHYGARFLRREIERSVAGVLADFIVTRRVGRGARLVLGVRNDAVFVGEAAPAAPAPVRRRMARERDVNAEAGAWRQRWREREAAAEADRMAASALIAESHRPGFWDDPDASAATLGRYRALDAMNHARERLLRVVRRLDAPMEPAELEALLPEVEAAWRRWEQLGPAGEEPEGRWLWIRPAEAIGAPDAGWLAELVAIELAWCHRLGLRASAVAEMLVSARVAGAVLEVEGAGLGALAMEAGHHRRKKGGRLDRLAVELVPRGRGRPAPGAVVSDARRQRGTFVEERRARLALTAPTRGGMLAFAGSDRETLQLLGADLLDWLSGPLPELEPARLYGFDGVAARDPRTGESLLGAKELARGELEGLLRAWEG
jgi:MoxR-like ATPase